MTTSSKLAGVTVALAFFMVLSAICGAGWYQAHNHVEELTEQRIRDLEQRLTAFMEYKGIPVTDADKSRAIANRAFAEVLIFRQRPRLIGDQQDIESREQFEVYRQTQARMIKSPFVLAAALRNPAIANLNLLKDQPHPEKILEERLEVDFPATEFMRISFNGARSPDAAKIVNAVVTEYLNEVVNAENNARNSRIIELEKAHRELSEQLRTRRTQLKKLVKNLQTGDREALSEKQKSMIELHSALRKERTQRHLDLMNARIRLAAFDQAGKSNQDGEIPESGIDDQLVADAEIQRGQADIKRRQETVDTIAKTTKDTQGTMLVKAKHDLEAGAEESRSSERQGPVDDRRQTADRSKGRGWRFSSQLLDSVRVAELTIKQIDDEMEKQKVETQQTGEWSLEIEALRGDVEQEKAIDQRLTDEMQRLKIEMKAGSRVTLYREADA